MYKLLSRIGLVFFITLYPLAGQAQEDSEESFLQQTWGDLREELENARNDGKKGIFLFFEMDECPFCRRMKQNIFVQPEVREYYHQHFLVFPIDIEGDTELTDFTGKVTTSKGFAEELRVRATPVIIFFDLEGRPVHRHTGPTRDAREFLWLGEFVADEHFRAQKFSTFRRSKRAGQ